MPYTYTTHVFTDEDTELAISGTVKRNPFYTRNIYAEHFSPDEEPFDINITSPLPDGLTPDQMTEIEEALFECYAEDGEEHTEYRTHYQ